MNSLSMPDVDRQVILSFAAGDLSKRGQAIMLHRQWGPVIGFRGAPEQDFMAETDTPCPDLFLRAKYRATLLDLRAPRRS